MLDDAFACLQKLVLPDPWQAQAIHALQAGRDVIVDAPTGAGKTYIFERHWEQADGAPRAIFTVPTRALANDKYAEWRALGWRVGITTGDVAIDPLAPLVVATLEAAQSVLAADRLALGPARVLLVVDEYQWLADPARGNHYEGVLFSLPPQVQLLLLSGSVGNADDVAAWLRRLDRDVAVVRTKERPVPLEEIDIDELENGAPRRAQSFWARRLGGALREGYGPILVFAPHRQDAERLARQFAREVPLAYPLALTMAQEQAAGGPLAKLLRQRVAFHHSGLSYAQRAGLIEPLAKAGQLRVVVATLGLSAGINFSLRSVLVTTASYRQGRLEHELQPHEILQMMGRAGRRGLDDTGYFLVSSQGPRLRRAEPQRLKRAAPLPWAFFLRQLALGEDAAVLAATSAHRFFTEQPLALGAEATTIREGDGGALPCHQRTDTGRARLVRRRRKAFPACRDCADRTACLSLSPQPTLIWQWQRVGVLDRDLRLTARGQIVRSFLGPEGLAVAAALQDRRYLLDGLVYDVANLFSQDRFCGDNPRRLGPLVTACEKAYQRLGIEGWLEEGVPVAYGYGASEIVQAITERTETARGLLATQEHAGRGDVDRLLTEWRSLLRQVAGAMPITLPLTKPETWSEHWWTRELHLRDRWDDFRALCRDRLGDLKGSALPDLPPLTADQQRPINHQMAKIERVMGASVNRVTKRPGRR